VSSITFTMTERAGSETTISVFADSFEQVVTESHPNYRQIVQYFLDTKPEERDEEALRRLVDVGLSLREAIAQVSDRVSVDENLSTVRLDGIVQHGALAARIRENLQEGDLAAVKPLVRFLLNLDENPSRQAQQAVFEWVTANGLTLTKDGHFLGYKAVRNDGFSKSSGPNNFVNGVLYKDGEYTRVPHNVGDVISKKRADVDDTPGGGCSVGLHVGTEKYARGFAPRLMIVKINPRDVVSAPGTRALEYKIRVCRYQVVSLATPAIMDGGVYHNRRDREGDLERLSQEQRQAYDLARRAGESHRAAYQAVTAPPPVEEIHFPDQEQVVEVEDVNLPEEEAPLVEPTKGTGLLGRVVLRDWAEANPSLKADLEDRERDIDGYWRLGHKEVGRKYSEITTESSVRRYRKRILP
jgi:hypothetical protein